VISCDSLGLFRVFWFVEPWPNWVSFGSSRVSPVLPDNCVDFWSFSWVIVCINILGLILNENRF
jgi:hypothetical protein